MVTKIIAQGEKPGQVPQGYIKVPVLDENGVLIKKKEKIVTQTECDGDRYDMVQKMWRMLLSGVYSPPQIRKIANNDWKFRTRRTPKTGDVPLTASMIYKIFNNPFYAGYISHGGELYEGRHKPMITLKEFDYAQRLLGTKGKNRQGTYIYAFASMIRCGVCDCLVGGKTNVKLLKSTNARKVYVHYYCTRKSEYRPCNQRIYTSLESIEEQIASELQKYTILPEFRDLAIKILRRNNKIEIKERKQVYESQQKRRNQIQDQLDKLIDMRTRDMLDDDEFMSQKRILKNELVRIDDLLRSTEKRADNWLELTEEAFDFATYAAIRFKTTDDAMVKRHILATLGANFVLKDQKLTITPNEWLIPIKEQYPALEKAYLNARTNKNSSSPDREKLFEEIFQSWRAQWGSNPRHPA
ncbi:recombinase family protein [Candidatus Saccharibacteria bacterium]|nr:recombinase family protein [Candidatus Saccharibacteria bacterium]